jgi:hypothetical protein
MNDQWRKIREEFENIVGHRDPNYRLLVADWHCPMCGMKLNLRSAPLKNDAGIVWRGECTNRLHYHSQWHRTQRGVLMELIATFETGGTK